MHAEANNLTSILDGRLNPDELSQKLPDRFENFQITEKRWVSGNPNFGQEIELFECISNIFGNIYLNEHFFLKILFKEMVKSQPTQYRRLE